MPGGTAKRRVRVFPAWDPTSGAEGEQGGQPGAHGHVLTDHPQERRSLLSWHIPFTTAPWVLKWWPDRPPPPGEQFPFWKQLLPGPVRLICRCRRSGALRGVPAGWGGGGRRGRPEAGEGLSPPPWIRCPPEVAPVGGRRRLCFKDGWYLEEEGYSTAGAQGKTTDTEV